MSPAPLGTSPLGVSSLADAEHNFLAVELEADTRSTRYMLAQCTTYLQLYEITVPGGDPIRWVDYYGRRGGDLPGTLTYGGETYQAASIGRAAIRESDDSLTQDFTISVVDLDFDLQSLLEDHGGLGGQEVTLTVLPLDRIDDPTDDYTRTFKFRVKGDTIGPHGSVTLILGSYSTVGKFRPNRKFSPTRCAQNYGARHEERSGCFYPSDAFDYQTEQKFRRLTGEINGIVNHQHGWSVVNAARAGSWVTTGGSFELTHPGERWMVVDSFDSTIAWNNALRDGPFCYKSIPGRDFDVWTEIVPGTIGSRGDWLAGLLAQDSTGTGYWVFAGLADDGAGGEHIRMRSTVAEVSTDQNTANASSHPQVRLTRVDDLLTMYSRADDADTWVERSSATVVLGDNPSIGLVIASDEVAGTTFTSYFRHLRFLKGGLPTCRQDWADCRAHGNSRRFTAWRKMSRAAR